MIHENKAAPAEGMVEEKIASFGMRYDSIVQRAGEEYEATPPSDYYKDGYNLYLQMVKYKHNHLLFLSNPLVEPDNNLQTESPDTEGKNKPGNFAQIRILRNPLYKGYFWVQRDMARSILNSRQEATSR